MGLYGLWLVSLVLSGIALGIMVALIIGRLVNERLARTRQTERERLIPLVLRAAPGAQRVGQKVKHASDLLSELVVELIQLVRGEDRERYLENAAYLGVPQRLRARLKSRSARARLSAAEALGEFNDEESLAALLEALDDAHLDVRLTAALSLASLDKAPPATTLIEKLAFEEGESSMLIVGLFEDIARTRADEIRALIESPDSSDLVKAAAIEALAASGDYALVPIITSLAIESDPMSQELPRYLRVLGEFAHPAATPAVVQCLSSPAWWVRTAAAEAAGRIGLVDAAPRLAEMLDDSDWWVRFRAGEALCQLGEDGQRKLREAARKGSELARRTASLTLAERGMAA